MMESQLSNFRNQGLRDAGTSSLISLESRSLTFKEPDFVSLPLSWVDVVSNTLRILRIQRDTVESVGLLPEVRFTGLQKEVFVGKDVDSNTSGVRLMRDDSDNENESGWFIGAIAPSVNYNASGNVIVTSAYEAMVTYPRLRKFFAWPAPIEVEIDNYSLTIRRSGESLTVRSGTFLDTMSSRKEVDL